MQIFNSWKTRWPLIIHAIVLKKIHYVSQIDWTIHSMYQLIKRPNCHLILHMWNALTSDLMDQYMLNVGFRVSRNPLHGIKELFGHIYGQFGWHILQCYVNIVKKSNVVKRRYAKIKTKVHRQNSCRILQWFTVECRVL